MAAIKLIFFCSTLLINKSSFFIHPPPPTKKSLFIGFRVGMTNGSSQVKLDKFGKWYL